MVGGSDSGMAVRVEEAVPWTGVIMVMLGKANFSTRTELPVGIGLVSVVLMSTPAKREGSVIQAFKWINDRKN